MSFTEQKENWETLAEKDPMWAVLSKPEKLGGRWDEEEFYATGEAEAREVMGELRMCGLEVGTERMLELGCGPGRVCHGFAAGWFKEVNGYDISEEMLRLARQTEQEGNERFWLNNTDDLSPFDDKTFDFVYCSKVLQHVDPDRVGNYMAEMVRVLKSGGVLFCQMLSHPTGWEGSTESSPDPGWDAHYTVCTVPLPEMMKAWMELDVIIHQARLVEKGEGQSLFSYDYVVERR